MVTIEADMSASGRLAVLGQVVLEGRFEGQIVCTRLEIGPDGYLLGEAVADEVVVAGQVVGVVRARRVLLATSAILEGEVVHESLQMDGAATLVGESRRHKTLEMPEDYVNLHRREQERQTEMRNIEVAARVRRIGTAVHARAAYDELRSRFASALAG